MATTRVGAIFDLDGTLVQTEALKARSYARAAVELSPETVRAEEIIVAYDDMVGHSREEVAAMLLSRFELEEPATRRMAELGVETPLDAYMALRLAIYEAMIEDERLIREQEYPWSTALLREVRRAGFPVGIATMSHRKHAMLVLERLGLAADFDVLCTREDVREAKPSPEIFFLIAERMDVEPRNCFVLEDSLPGVRAAIAAGMRCVAITNDMTRDAIRAAGVLPARRIVDDPSLLGSVAREVLAELARSR
ncbi:MAG: HAD family phosphatase [Gemmatimonadaceae bacterium]|nr:HAD family phosphatase [Gemmatimonadaceae bacterium]